MKKLFALIIFFFLFVKVNAQELYVFTEPASNMPAHSISGKLTGHFVTTDNIYGRFSQRFMPQVMFGFSKKIMVHVGATISNMHTDELTYESFSLYAKYRFLSHDEIHKHFRMAVFIDGSATRAPFHYDEITLMGDKNGVELGLIATQLWNKLALSGTISHVQVLDRSRKSDVIYVPARAYQSMNYSLSAGYLLIPKEYTNYKQLNINLYTELLAEQTLDIKKYCVDLAPAIQFIFNSNAKLNIGYRFQVSGNMSRMSTNSWLVSFERTFLNALKKK
ncbi:MAG TPA: hypothetical protein VK483_08510 [Chitinophagaceae bacterium]|nr:hypothetical protein [Chitinophagaceae bacterium]